MSRPGRAALASTIDRVRNRDAATSVVFVVAGPAGSGKTTLGRALAAATGAVVLDQDLATNPLLAQLAGLVGAGDDLDAPGLRGPVRQARYQCLLDVAADNSGLGRDVVMIAPFTAECSDKGAWSELAARFAPAPVRLIWVSVPPDLALARRIERNLPRDRAMAGRSPVLPPPRPVIDHLTASGSADPTAEAARIVGLLGP